MPGEVLQDEPLPGVVRLTISHPGRRNALDHPILDALTRAVLAAQDRKDVACLMVTGAGGAFSSGYDLADLPEEDFAEEAERLIAHPFTGAIDALEATDLPTVAVLPGAAIGGGLELALACDLRVAHHGVSVGMPPARLGLVYSHTGLERFVRAIGEPRTRQLFLLGRSIDAHTALDWGLLNEVVDERILEDVGLRCARRLVANAPLSLRGTKRVLRELARADRPLAQETEEELLELRRESLRSEDLREAVDAFTATRPPRWRGR